MRGLPGRMYPHLECLEVGGIFDGSAHSFESAIRIDAID
jgi:hypothetical protein